MGSLHVCGSSGISQVRGLFGFPIHHCSFCPFLSVEMSSPPHSKTLMMGYFCKSIRCALVLYRKLSSTSV